MGLTGRKVDKEAHERHAEDQRHAELLPGLLETVAAAERELRAAQNADIDIVELHQRGVELDTALTDAVRAAYAKERVLVGPRGYNDRIFRRKQLAKPHVRQATEAAERLLTARETHRLHGIEEVPRRPAAA